MQLEKLRLHTNLTNCIGKENICSVKHLHYEESGPISAVEEAFKKPLKNESQFFSYKIGATPTDFEEYCSYCTVGEESAMIKIKRNKLAFFV